ncbi:MAG: isochorismate synthase [Thiohalocapsa sp.]
MLAPNKILERLKSRLAETLGGLPLGAGDAPGEPVLLSLLLSLPRPPIGAPQLDGRQFQFLHGHGSEMQAGYGCAAEWEADGPDRLDRLARIATGVSPRWHRVDPDETGFDAFALLGFAAGSDAGPQVEDHLPNAILWVPEIGLRVQDRQAVLMLSARLPATRAELELVWNAALERLVPKLYLPLPGPLMAATLARDFAEPDFGGWSALIGDALAEIEDGALEKVVLSRRLDVTGPRCFDVGRLVGALSCLFPSCQIVNLRRNGKSFVAATPERLLSRRGSRLTVDAIAGTAPRAESTERDAELTDALRNSDKNLREHRCVINAITDALSDCCDDIATPSQPLVMQLANAQHLWSPIEAAPRAGANVFQLAECLHPTPATNGQPRDLARDWLRVGEPFDRGWYTGAAGIVEPDLSGELWVLLRCARICGDRAELYAGAGIVSGSDARSEWDETEAKLQAMLTALQYA